MRASPDAHARRRGKRYRFIAVRFAGRTGDGLIRNIMAPAQDIRRSIALAAEYRPRINRKCGRSLRQNSQGACGRHRRGRPISQLRAKTRLCRHQKAFPHKKSPPPIVGKNQEANEENYGYNSRLNRLPSPLRARHDLRAKN